MHLHNPASLRASGSAQDPVTAIVSTVVLRSMGLRQRGEEKTLITVLGPTNSLARAKAIRSVRLPVRRQQHEGPAFPGSHGAETVSYTHLRAHETPEHLVC